MDAFMKIRMPYEYFKISPRGNGRGRASQSKDFTARAARFFLLKSILQNRQGVSLMTGVRPKKSFSFGQRCVVKVRYVSNAYKDHNFQNEYKTQWRNHANYLQRQGAQHEDKRGLGFDENEDELDMKKKMEKWQLEGDDLMWKVIVSPERGVDVDLKKHTRELMKNVEKDLGTKLQYVAIDHYNTEHPHVHLVIRGVREDGTTLEIDKDYFTAGFRTRSQEILTKELGLRTELDMMENRRKMVNERHITELDRLIDTRLINDNIIHLDWTTKNHKLYQTNCVIKQRLEFLEELKVVSKLTSASWYVDPKFIDYLRYAQEQDDIIKAKNKNINRIIEKDAPVLVNRLSNVGDVVLGMINGSGVNERNEEERYLLVEGVDAKLHYIPMNNRLAMMRDNGQLKNGALVYLERAEFEAQNTIEKARLSRIEGIKGTIFDPASTGSVWKEVTATEVKLKEGKEISDDLIKSRISGDFDKIKSILKEAQEYEIRTYIKADSFNDWDDINALKNEITDMDRYVVKNMVKANDDYKKFMSVERQKLDLDVADRGQFKGVKKFYIPDDEQGNTIKQKFAETYNTRLGVMEEQKRLKLSTSGDVRLEEGLVMKTIIKHTIGGAT